MAQKRKPKGRPGTSLEELIAAGKVLKQRADKAYAELLAIASEIREMQRPKTAAPAIGTPCSKARGSP
jgi:hypothetical protein